MKFIGLAGKAGSGKNTIAQHICYSQEMWEFSFASTIKNMICALRDEHVGFESWLESDKEDIIPEMNLSYRELMQSLGDWGRNHHPDFWIDCMTRSHDYDLAEKEMLLEPDRWAVITDVRFENEADWIRNQGGVIWHIERRSIPKVRDHISEDGIQKKSGEAILTNDGSHEMLIDQANFHLLRLGFTIDSKSINNKDFHHE